ncbi:NUDIX hydrolase [Romboutsia weinsteinii]|uniref:NUDIX hydrolase n=1 Tax=Romboutsia weinsteinii TaxID=2020949 RepID=A0A371J8T2_9FIRM|nr:NUDIX hydrolase [Romboutsia weinsteinii]RDY29190.1 NUDIX hydrolase [Romboutsia weinsteinii]
MIVRHCAGGVVFYANKVLILKNDRNEWTLPKGKIYENGLPVDSAVKRVAEETGAIAKVLDVAGDTMYEFYSRSRQQEVCNAVVWYIMESNESKYILKDEFKEGGFFKVKEAVEMLTHSKEKSLVELSYKKYKEIKKKGSEDQSLAVNCK